MPRFVSLIVYFALGGCAVLPHVTTEVEVFHDLSPDYTGKNIVIVSADPNKAGSPEFSVYAAKLSAKLAGAGFQVIPQEAGSSSDYVALLAYGVGAQQAVGSYTMGNVAPDAMGGAEYQGLTVVAKEYPRALVVGIVKIGKREGEQSQLVYTMTAASVGDCRTLSSVIDPMLDAVFSDFPGRSGKARQVTIPTFAEISC